MGIPRQLYILIEIYSGLEDYLFAVVGSFLSWHTAAGGSGNAEYK